ncbi:pilus assembly protein CpaB [Elusimicrobium posterum]|uniref:Flp pilus assembly protein CpaB n=1 Tax=Elusimicrobium posterum TaxID=3116653 RepID=UPI003C71E545
MKKGVLLPLIVAALAAVVYMYILTSNQKEAEQGSKRERVLIAARDLSERKVIAKGDLSYKEVPVNYLQQDAYIVTKESDITKLHDNWVTRIPIAKGNQISKSALTTLSPDTGLSSRVSPLWRGFVLTGVESSVASLIKPDDLVDILLTFEAVMRDGKKERVTATLLQKIKVLGVGSDLGQGIDANAARANREREANMSALTDSSAISLALDPRDAQYLALAKEEGTITIIVRRKDDLLTPAIKIASLGLLFNPNNN